MGPPFLRVFCMFFEDFKLDRIQNYTNPRMPVMVQCLFQLVVNQGGRQGRPRIIKIPYW